MTSVGEKFKKFMLQKKNSILNRKGVIKNTVIWMNEK